MIKAKPTMKKTMGFAKENGFDGFIMLNLYPQRAAKPNGLTQNFNDELHKRNLEYIRQELFGAENPDILLAFGNNIAKRAHLKRCLKDIIALPKRQNPRYFAISLTKVGNPRHLLYAPYSKFVDFDVNRYKYD